MTQATEMRHPAHPERQPHQRRSEVGTRKTSASRPGSALRVRATTVRDQRGLREMFSRLSPQTIYYRFHAPYSHVPEWMGARLMDAERHGGGSLVAVMAAEEIVAHAMYVPSEEERDAEVGIVVEDSWQSKGVGKLLLSELAEEARVRGVESFTAEVTGENRRVLRLFAAVFPETRRTIRQGIYHVRMPLRGPAEPAVLAQRLREVA